MKTIFGLLCFALVTGCHTPAPATLLPLPPKSAPEPRPIATPPAPKLPPPPELKTKQQAQLIEALISQNEALTEKLAALAVAAPKAEPVTTLPPVVETAPNIPSDGTPTNESYIVPNADGVIDLAAVALANTAGEPTNPFALRSVATEKTRELTLQLGGIIVGANPCAVMNGRIVQRGDTVESLAVERIEQDAVILSHGEYRLRLPVAEKPVRVRLAL
ncbi:MAG: general secretion pathway protein GspB [Opitutaceae bacterium]|jgi:hypothetical protein